LLSDAELDAALACHVVQQRPIENAAVRLPQTRTTVLRSTFLIDREGIVSEALNGVGAQGDAQRMLERVGQLLNS